MSSAGDPLPGLEVRLRKGVRGPVIASEAALGRDIAEAFAELGFEAGLRRGGPPISFSDLKAQLRPVRRSDRLGGHFCAGFVLETDWPPGETTRCSFGRDVLEPVAARISRKLIEAGELAEGSVYFYELEVDDAVVGPLDLETAASPPMPEERPLAPLLARSRSVAADYQQGLADEAYAQAPGGNERLQLVGQDAGDAEPSLEVRDTERFPVFYSRRALVRAEQISRRGASASPPIETGGLLIGRLCWCPESRTLFCLIEDVLEAAQTEATTYTLTFTGKTWSRVQTILRARQKNAATRGQRPIGQFHGHNFLPYDSGATCDGCPSQGQCKLSTAYLSESDRRWCRAVFPHEPWQLSHIFGLTPRREPVSAFYGQRAAALERRGYYVLEDDQE